MSASAGIGFDLIWQTAQWRQQLDAAQTDLQSMASNVSQLQIMIPVVMEDRITAQVDALIAEIEATRSINIPVNIVGGGGGGFTGGSRGFGGGGGGAEAAEFGSVEWMNDQYERERQRVIASQLRRDFREARSGFQESVSEDLAAMGVTGGVASARVERNWDAASFAQFRQQERMERQVSGINKFGGAGDAYGPAEQFTQEEVQAGVSAEASYAEMARLGGGIGTTESMMAGGAGAAVAGGGSSSFLPRLGIAFMAYRALREGVRDYRDYSEGMDYAAQANITSPGTAQTELWIKAAQKQQGMYGGIFGGLARMGQSALMMDGDNTAGAIDESIVSMQASVRTTHWQESQLRERIRNADIGDTTFTQRLAGFKGTPLEDIADQGIISIGKRRNAEAEREEKERDRESERLFNEQERALREAERQKERDARLDSSSERRIGDVAGRSAEAGLRSDGLSVAAGRDELLRSNRDQVAAMREMAAATDDLKEKTRLLNEAQAEESAGTQRVSAYDHEASRAHRERIQSLQDETQQMTLRTSNRTDEAQMLQATKQDNEAIAQTQERIASARKRLADTDKDFSEETDENGKVIERYIGPGTSAQGQAEAQERRSLNEGLGEDQEMLGAQTQHREASTAQVRKEQQQHLTDMATETAANEARAHGQNQEGDFIELQARVRKEIADAPASERDSTRKLATSQLDRFIHGESKPFMGSMDQFGDDLQMQVLQNDPHAIAQAQAMKKQINDPAGTLGGIAKGIGSWLGIGGDDKGHGDPHEKTKSAGEKLESAAEKLLAAAIKFGGITIMDAF